MEPHRDVAAPAGMSGPVDGRAWLSFIGKTKPIAFVHWKDETSNTSSNAPPFSPIELSQDFKGSDWV